MGWESSSVAVVAVACALGETTPVRGPPLGDIIRNRS